MTTIIKTMTNNEYWNKISYSPSSYFDEIPLNLINDVLAADIDCFDPFDAILEDENEELSPIEVEIFNSSFLILIFYD